MNQTLFNQSNENFQNLSNQNYYNFYGMNQTEISQIYHSNSESSENYNNNKIKEENYFLENFPDEEKNTFLKKKSNYTLLNDEDNLNRNFNYKSCFKKEKKTYQKVKNKQSLNSNKNNYDDNKENINDSLNFIEILKMSIQEKKNNDKIERELKKANKIHLIKIQQRNKFLFGNIKKY